MKTLLTVSFSAMMLFGLAFATIPDAFANPGHEITYAKPITTTGGTNTMQIAVDENGGPEVIGTATWFGYNPQNTVSIGQHPACSDPTNYQGLNANNGPNFPPDQVWGLFDNNGAGEQPMVHFPGLGLQTVNVRFGDGDNAEVTTGGTPTIFDGGNVGATHAARLADAPDGDVRWRSVANVPAGAVGGLADSIGAAQLGIWFGTSCGFADIQHNAVFDFDNILTPQNECDDPNTPGVVEPCDNPGGVTETFTVVAPVGGEILSIDTTALLIAGASANALWILPALAIAAGAAFTVLKLQVNRRTI